MPNAVPITVFVIQYALTADVGHREALYSVLSFVLNVMRNNAPLHEGEGLPVCFFIEVNNRVIAVHIVGKVS